MNNKNLLMEKIFYRNELKMIRKGEEGKAIII